MRPPPRLPRSLPRHLPRPLSCRCHAAPRGQQRRPLSSTPTLDPRTELEQLLLELKKHAAGYTNVPRLQLALQGLQQAPGSETIRLAVLGLDHGGGANGARDVLRLLLADPLTDTQAWEVELSTEADANTPVIVRVGGARGDKDDEAVVKTAKPSMLREISADAPVLRGQPVEVLAMRANFAEQAATTTAEAAEEAMLVPMVDIPAAAGRFFPIRTPVHRALLFSSGIAGAARLCALPVLRDGDGTAFGAAVDLPNYTPGEKEGGDLPFVRVDLGLASEALALFRQGPQHAIEYERLWHRSNMPALVSWLKAAVHTPAGATNPAVRQLVASLLDNTLSRIAAEETHQAAQALIRSQAPSSLPTDVSTTMAPVLGEWAQRAHAELQDQLDAAFSGNKWRMLRWWKLLWRVDDVAALTNEILASRFLPTAERELVYLAGRMEQARGEVPTYAQPVPTRAAMPEELPIVIKSNVVTAMATESIDTAPITPTLTTPATPLPTTTAKWPHHISFTRTYLSTSTVPALQALAQKLVVQGYSTAVAATSVGGLVWASSSLYEAGAVAALGLVWGMRGMQRRWDAARVFWEGEVREEGRKALRAAEKSVGDALVGKKVDDDKERKKEEEDGERRTRAREMVDKARVALERMR